MAKGFKINGEKKKKKKSNVSVPLLLSEYVHQTTRTHSFPRTSLHHNSTYIFKTSEFFLFKEEINVCEEQSETLSSDWIQTHVCPNFTLENSFEKLTKI